MFISILITLYINRQQAINSKSINNISSGEDIDLAIFFSRRCKSRGGEGMEGEEGGGALRCSGGMNRWKEMGELRYQRRYGIQELAMDINGIFSREAFIRRLLD